MLAVAAGGRRWEGVGNHEKMDDVEKPAGYRCHGLNGLESRVVSDVGRK